ncbi:MAG: ABC transporter permease [Acidobacteriota bacterium]|nr:ABC transporter permease [Acidobacteriota bacterium]
MIKIFRNLMGLWKYRVLIQNLVSRELKARYRGTVLGYLWSLFNPLLLMVIYTIVFGFIIGPRDPAFNNSPVLYALFLFCGVLPWSWFTSSSIESANVLMIQGNLIKKVLFPAEVLPVVVVTSNFIHFLFGLPILLAAKTLISIFVPKAPGFSVYLAFLPLVMFVQFVFSLGFGFLLSALTVHFRDIKDILANLLTFWFFATPIIYPMSFHTVQKSALFRTFLDINPMTHIMMGYQNTVFYGTMIHWKKLGVTFLVSIILLLIGAYVFDKLRDSFPEEV